MFQPGAFAGLLSGAGLEVDTTLVGDLDSRVPQACLLARRPPARR
ncbi:hypothetical protein [Streptomyces sp. YIM 98790]|nr:hypothetical protein [Streptomyces sp. YIM 98790]